MPRMRSRERAKGRFCSPCPGASSFRRADRHSPQNASRSIRDSKFASIAALQLPLSLPVYVKLLLFDGTRWLGLPVYDRSKRHKGPGGPHPRAKIPEGKVGTDFVSLETILCP